MYDMAGQNVAVMNENMDQLADNSGGMEIDVDAQEKKRQILLSSAMIQYSVIIRQCPENTNVSIWLWLHVYLTPAP